eukprot:CAMPEP_0194596828 /NCGR_PEP_ID=MMETSP0292-20121207/25914_1 /TAXON_ID=39354 /ORGANISM="Heterosigma akashiwo, Strain CCMP2393" /LENGTH=55 /DNA_ID=CAMNT_0039457209 /DNA_START=207 /DNA_END=374 /DNA_ORIENTATION=-
MNSVGPDQAVAATGRPMAMASACGRPQPSPRVGSATAPAAAYSARSPAWDNDVRS